MRPLSVAVSTGLQRCKTAASAWHDAPETVTQMVFAPWSSDTGGLTGVLYPGIPTEEQEVLQ